MTIIHGSHSIIGSITQLPVNERIPVFDILRIIDPLPITSNESVQIPVGLPTSEHIVFVLPLQQAQTMRLLEPLGRIKVNILHGNMIEVLPGLLGQKTRANLGTQPVEYAVVGILAIELPQIGLALSRRRNRENSKMHMKPAFPYRNVTSVHDTTHRRRTEMNGAHRKQQEALHID